MEGELEGCGCSFLWDAEDDGDGWVMRESVALFEAPVLDDLEGSGGGGIRFELLLLRSEKQPASSITDDTPPDGIVLKSTHILLVPIFLL
jgi:hypothetical protein